MSSIFQRVKNEIISNKRLREEGKDLVIPWINFPKLSAVIPGVQRGRYIIVTAASKAGKSQITDSLFVMEPLNYIRNHNTNIKVRIFYFSLEMSKEDKIAQLISNKIFVDRGVVIPPDKLRSFYRNYIAEDWIVDILESEEYTNYFTFLEDHIEYVDYIRNPTGIYVYMREHSRRNGKFYFKGVEVIIPENADWSKYSYDLYIPNDPDDFNIVITDHISLLEQERGAEDTRAAMHKFSSVYCLKMRDIFKCCVINIQQQALDSDKPQYNRDGGSIIDKLRPSTDGFGDMKLSVRDADIILGLFNPSKYNIKQYPDKTGYDISKWGDHYRELSIIANRRSQGNLNLHLYFNGAINHFEELPDSQLFLRNASLYNNYRLD